MDIWFRIFTAVIGTIGFSILFRLEVKRLPFAALGGFLACGVYFLFLPMVGGNEFIANFIGAFVATSYCEICARLLKAPVVVFLIPCLIPLVPGKSLYYTMSGGVSKNFDAFSQNGLTTVEIAAGIAGGIIFASIFFYMIKSCVPFWQISKDKE